MAIKSNLPAALAAIETSLVAKNAAAAIEVENSVKRITPVDTGRLRDSITHDSDKDGFIVGTNTEYAPFVELGTSKAPAQPYLIPGLMNAKEAISGIYGSGLDA